jgi:Domain of unknown function (DUF4345)
MFAVIVLLFAGLQLLAFGIWAIFDPAGLLGPLGFAFNQAPAWVEVRAFYGGLQTALGGLLCYAAMHARWRAPALMLVAAGFAGIALVRAVGMLSTGAHTTFLVFALCVEVLLVVLAVLALRMLSARE